MNSNGAFLACGHRAEEKRQKRLCEGEQGGAEDPQETQKKPPSEKSISETINTKTLSTDQHLVIHSPATSETL